MRKLLFLSVAIIGSLILLSCGSTDSTTNYQVSISASPSEGGIVSPSSGQYEEGTSLDISATASEEYRFVKWQGDYQGTNSSATITVDSDKNIQAIFAKKEYALTINTEGEGTVDETVVQAKSTDYEHGTVVELTANPGDGWKFVEWTGAITESKNPAQITVDEPKEVTVVFEKKSYELTVNTDGEGTVNEDVVQARSTEYDHGAIVELTANPAEGWEFVEWQGDINSSENPAQITVDEAKEVTAVFEKKSFAVNINTEGEGSVTKNPDQENYTFQSNLELEATPATGYQFVEWQGDIESTENPVTVTVDTDPNFTAVFEKENYSLTVNTEGEGTVTKEPDQTEYAYNSTVNLTANPAEGWKFVKWQGDISSTENSAEITIDEPKEVTAVFEKKQFSVTTSIQGDGNIIISPQKETYEYNEEIEFTASSGAGYEFIEWNGSLSGKENPQTVKISEDIDVEAIFKTPEEALIYQRGGGVYINGRVNSATLNLYNSLPEPAELTRFALLDQDGDLVVENTDGATIPSEDGIGYTVSFGIQPTTEVFNNYTVRWEVDYNGKSYVKENLVESSNSNQKGKVNSMSISREFKINTDN